MMRLIADKTDVRSGLASGLVSDPNREGDEEYIVRLIARVVTVSVETQKLFEALPPLFRE